MKTLFIADDGTEFETEKECIEYEKNLCDIKNSFLMYDEKFELIDTETTYTLDHARYLYVLDNAQDVALYLKEEWGFGDGISGTGIYIAREEEFGWDSVDGLIDYHKEEIDKLYKIKQIMDKKR